MDNLGYLLGDSARLLRGDFDDRVRAIGVTGPQARLLLKIARNEGENQGFFADALDVEPITLCRMVDRMTESGLIERRPDPADRRARQLHLTEHGRSLIGRLRAEVDVLVEAMLGGVNADERELFTRTLIAIHANLAARREQRSLTHG